MPSKSQNQIADELHKKYVEAPQRHFIETKTRLKPGEVVSEKFESDVKKRFKGFQAEGEDWFN